LWRCIPGALQPRGPAVNRLLRSFLRFFLSLGFRFCLRGLYLGIGPPPTVGQPAFGCMGSASDRKKALRDAGFEGFVYRLGLQCHGHRIGFVSPRIVELAVDSDHDWDQLRPALGVNFQQSHRPRPGVRLTLLGELGIGEIKKGRTHQHRANAAQGDGARQFAV